MSTKYDELEVPSGVYENDDGVELVRFWASGGDDHVSLNIGIFPKDEEVEIWGAVCADIALHAVRGMQQDDPTRGSAEQMLAQIEMAFAKHLSESSGQTGQLKGAH